MARRPAPSQPSFITGDTIADVLAEAGINLGRERLRAGVDVKATCPACGGGRTKERSLSIRLDDDGAGAVWKCHRATCPGSSSIPGSGRLESANAGRREEVPQRRERPVPIAPQLDPPYLQHRTEGLYEWFATRGISEETVDAFGIYGRAHRFPQAGGEWVEKPTVVFPYVWRGDVVNRKFRSVDKDFQQDRGALRTLFNVDAWETKDVGILVEGEMDVLACWEAGYRQVASLPDGAPQKLHDEGDLRREGDKRFYALEECAEVLADVRKIVVATDADVPGGYLAEELARRLGRIRCYRARWPEGCKDANDVLLRHVPIAERGKRPLTSEELEAGRADVQASIDGAQPWPLEGIVEIQQGQLREFLRSGRQPRGLESGIRSLDEMARLPAGAGWLTIVTGIPSHGKTSVVRPWITYLARRHDLGIIWCSPEDNAAETVALEVARIIAGQPLHEAGTYIPDVVLAEAEKWIGRNISFLQSNNPDLEMSLEWVLKRAEEAKRRQLRHLLVLDPFNEFEHQFARGETETQYIGRWLRRLKAWGRAEGMSVIIVAHPKTQLKDPRTGRYPVVEGYDINGGANWNNKADLGLTVYRAEEGYTNVHCWKARFASFGKRGAKARLKLDNRSGRLSSMNPVYGDDAIEPS